MALLTIDGACGEGGGQSVRTALSLVLCTGRPIRVSPVRPRRAKPGLRQQHEFVNLFWVLPQFGWKGSWVAPPDSPAFAERLNGFLLEYEEALTNWLILTGLIRQ